MSARCDRPILVVEDDRDIRESLQDVLETEGYAVETASNGSEGLACVRSKSPCVVLLDLMMPVMSGSEFLARLRRDCGLSRLPVLIVSAWPREAAKLRSDAQGFVRKPVALDSLLAMVERYCAEDAPGDAP